MSTPRMPKGAGIGDRLTFEDRTGGTLPDAAERTGTIIDRAPQGWNPRPGIDADTFEASGYWLWVMPDDPHPTDTGSAVRVRYMSRGRDKGRAYRDDGPMCVTGRLAYGHAAGSRKVTVQELIEEMSAA